MQFLNRAEVYGENSSTFQRAQCIALKMFPLNRLFSVPDACWLYQMSMSIFYLCSKNFSVSLICWERALMCPAVLWCWYHLPHLSAGCCILCSRHIQASQPQIWKPFFAFNNSTQLTSKMVTLIVCLPNAEHPFPTGTCNTWCHWLTGMCWVRCFRSQQGWWRFHDVGRELWP